jgi:metal-sulfur cluster biosynthetic enzyme
VIEQAKAEEGTTEDSAQDELIVGALRTVIDPEIGLDIVTLGLVYEVHLKGDSVRVLYTLTTPGCPMERVITQGIVTALSNVPGIASVEPDLTFTPRWNPGMAEEGALW